MSQETEIIASVSEANRIYRWIVCKGCDGEVGIPSDYSENSVECPNCQAKALVAGKVLFRAPAKAKPGPNPISAFLESDEWVPPVQPVVPAPAPVAAKPSPTRPTAPSLDLQRKADGVLIAGFLCIVFGWTAIVPLLTVFGFLSASEDAKKEKVLIPGNATVGLVLAILFGGVQTLAIISQVSK
jgi:DNA-directed RNA polymerase subunit RPC12/RpoP